MNGSARELNERLGIPGLEFNSGKAGWVRAVIETAVASGELYLHGAHVTGYQPRGELPVLWMSQRSYFEVGKPIRGGIPICFPWFGPHPTESGAPAHGLARTTVWEPTAACRLADGGVGLELAAEVGGFQLHYRVDFGRELRLTLRVETLPSVSIRQSFEEALHTYFAVGDVRKTVITGLEAAAYVDKVGGLHKRGATGAPISFAGETDRVYGLASATCRLADDALKRMITVEQWNAGSTVIWNPWIEKSRRMPDFGDDEWPEMVCIETANVGEHAISLRPGESHSISARISVRSGMESLDR